MLDQFLYELSFLSKIWHSPAGGRFNQPVSGYNKVIGDKFFFHDLWSLNFVIKYVYFAMVWN